MPAQRLSEARKNCSGSPFPIRPTRSSQRLTRNSPYPFATSSSTPFLPTDEPCNGTQVEAESPTTALVNDHGSMNRKPNGRVKRPKTAKAKSEGHIPRPPNAFILFRSHLSTMYRRKHEGRPVHSSETSRVAGFLWANLPIDLRALWTEKAKEADEAHKAKYPNYRYRPRKPNASKRKKRISKTDIPDQGDTLNVSLSEETQDMKEEVASLERASKGINSGEVEDLFSLLSRDTCQPLIGMQSVTSGHIPEPVPLPDKSLFLGFSFSDLIPVENEGNIQSPLQFPCVNELDASTFPINLEPDLDTVRHKSSASKMHLSHFLNIDFDLYTLPGTLSRADQSFQCQGSPETATFGPLLGIERIFQEVPWIGDPPTMLQDGENETDGPPIRNSEHLEGFSSCGTLTSLSPVTPAASRQPSVNPEDSFYISDEYLQSLFTRAAGVPLERSVSTFGCLKNVANNIPAEDEAYYPLWTSGGCNLRSDTD